MTDTTTPEREPLPANPGPMPPELIPANRSVRLRNVSLSLWETIYEVYVIDRDECTKARVGTVSKHESTRARNVKGMGGATTWRAQTLDGTIVSKSNTYRRIDALDALLDPKSEYRA